MRLKKRKNKKASKDKALVEKLLKVLEEVLDEWESVDAQEIEADISEKLSGLVKDEQIKRKRSLHKGLKKGPSLSEFIQAVIDDSDLVERAEYFEALMSPYDDDVDTDDLTEAFEVLEDIIAGIKQISRESDDASDQQ